MHRFFAARTAFREEKMTRSPVLIVLACLAWLSAQAQAAGNAEAAKGKVSMCIGCHGIPMYKTVFPEVYSVPMIAGQSPDYIVKALQAYRIGERSHPSMQGIAKSLTDQDMADVAAYYGRAGKAAK
jgi:cytochrome c553